jgi:hypothetical protein
MSAWERELGALPAPICPCSTARPGRDLLFLGIVLVLRSRPRNRKIEDEGTSNIEQPTTNIQLKNSRRAAAHWMFGVGCWLFDVFQRKEKMLARLLFLDKIFKRQANSTNQ